MCTRPTIINVYQCHGVNVVKRYYNIPYKEAIKLNHTAGVAEVIQLTKKDRERTGTKYTTEWAVLKSSQMIPCGQCAECAQLQARHLAQRIILELKESNQKAYFITLTYDNDHNPKKLSKEDAREFILKIKKDNPKVRYLITGEYGSHTQRPHYHAIIWNCENLKIKKGWIREKGKDHTNFLFTSKYWTKGDSTIANADEDTIYYTSMYSMKKTTRTKEEKEELKKHGIVPEFRILSDNIGHNYYAKHEEEIDKNKGRILLKEGHYITVDRSYIKWKLKNNKEKPYYFNNICNKIDITIQKPQDHELRSIRK